jgi:hypothetical protein
MKGAIMSTAILTRFGSANGSFSEKADPNIGLLGQFGPLGQSGLQIPNQPSSIVGLASDTATAVFAASERGMGVHGMNDAPTGGSIKPQFGCGVWGESTNGFGVFGSSDNNVGIFGTSSNGPAGKFAGNVEVTGKLDVAGDVTAHDLVLSGGDCAEDFDIVDTEGVDPGTVMVCDNDGALLRSNRPYDKRVAGVISGAGNYKPGIVLDKRQTQNNRMPIALVGKVYCKVDAQYSPIEVGDLLTTSPTPGHAMKADDPFKAFGTVIGKALKPWLAGQGLIPILIALL